MSVRIFLNIVEQRYAVPLCFVALFPPFSSQVCSLLTEEENLTQSTHRSYVESPETSAATIRYCDLLLSRNVPRVEWPTTLGGERSDTAPLSSVPVYPRILASARQPSRVFSCGERCGSWVIVWFSGTWVSLSLLECQFLWMRAISRAELQPIFLPLKQYWHSCLLHVTEAVMSLLHKSLELYSNNLKYERWIWSSDPK